LRYRFSGPGHGQKGVALETAKATKTNMPNAIKNEITMAFAFDLFFTPFTFYSQR
jgi:hypothetical protein